MINHNHRFQILVCIGIASLTAYLAVSIYLGTFTYYLADDYCEAVRVISAPTIIDAVLERYTTENWPRVTMRYSNLLFIGLGESFGKHNLPITMSTMIFFWFAGLTWSIRELRKLLGIIWNFQLDLFLGLFFGFFSFLQAPNLFQTIYWRSAMMTHFAPLVFGAFLASFIFRQARTSDKAVPSLVVCLIIFLASFIFAGFSEPPTTTALTALLLLLSAASLWGRPPAKRRYVALLAWTFAGVFLGLLAMMFSPATTNSAQEKSLDIMGILGTSFLYAYYFMVDSLKTQPLPSLISLSIPLMLAWLYTSNEILKSSHQKKRLIWVFILAIPVLVWVLIAAGFSPSVYGQGYPVERMRFLARSLMIAGFMLEGALLGLLLQHIQFKPNPQAGRIAVLAVFAVIMVVYPLRAAFNIIRYDLPEYRARAELWDLRNAYVIRHASMGEKDLAIPGFSGVYQVKEIDNNPNHWVNKCAARFYGVESIRAFTIPDEELLDYLNE